MLALIAEYWRPLGPSADEVTAPISSIWAWQGQARVSIARRRISQWRLLLTAADWLADSKSDLEIDPHYAPQKKPGVSISASQQRGFVAYVRHDWAFPYSAQAVRVQGILTT